MSIPEQAVEAAAKYLSEFLSDHPSDYAQEARELLEAAAPHMRGCDDALWREFQAATQQAGSNPSVVMRGLVREWVDNNTQHEGETE